MAGTVTMNGPPLTTARQRFKAVDYAIPNFAPLWVPEITYLPNGWGVAIATIGPELAKAMLALNREDNRNKRNTAFNKYADDMRSARWQLTHQGIAFDKTGHLCDGQHRLTACITADSPFATLVFFGAGGNQEMCVHDTGAPRNTSDASAYLIGERVNANLIATLRAFIYGISPARTPLTSLHILEQLDRYSAAMTFHRWAFTSNKPSATIRAAICRSYYHGDRADLIRFSHVLTERIDPSEPRDRAPKQLRKLCESRGGSGSGGAGYQCELYRKAQRAVRAYLDNDPIDKLYATAEDLFPLPTDEQIADRNALEESIAAQAKPTE